MKRNEFIIRLSDGRDTYFEILFGNKYDEFDELYSKVYSNEFNRIISEICISIETFEKILFEKDLCLILTGILMNESLTYCDKKDLTTKKFYQIEKFLRDIMQI